MLIDLTTGRRRVLPVRRGLDVTPLAWSPDSRWLVVFRDAPSDQAGRVIQLVPVDGGTALTRTPSDDGGLRLSSGLAWVSPSRYVALASEKTAAYDESLVTITVGHDAPQRLSTFLSQSDQHAVLNVSIAQQQALVWQLRPADHPDRGPRPLWWRLLSGVPTAFLAAAVVTVVLLRRSLRRRSEQ